MSKFLSSKFSALTPYTPGEQPQDMKYVKLNTNESPFAPEQNVIEAAKAAAGSLNLYSDPECKKLVAKLAETYGVREENIIVTNGSDEVLNFAFMAFCDKDKGAAAPDISYGFYPVFAAVNNVPFTEIPLKEDFSIDITDYLGLNKTIFIANPNAPTGIALTLDQIEQILKANENNIVVIDEAYVDFGADSAVKLIEKYDNLLVTMTFSKSRSLAGGRLGFGIASKEIIRDLNTIRYSTNPYNVNSMTLAAGLATLDNEEKVRKNCDTIIKNREYTAKALKNLGFTLTDSKANFIFAKSDKIGGEELYLKLKERGVLVRHFKLPRIKDFVRITIGTKKQMDILIKTVEEIL